MFQEWFVSRTRRKEHQVLFHQVLFFCFNGSFLKNRSKKGLFQEQKEKKTRCTFLLFNKEPGVVQEEEEQPGVCVFQKTRCCFLQEEQWFVSEEALFFCLFQEPLKEEPEEKKNQVLFGRTRNQEARC